MFLGHPARIDRTWMPMLLGRSVTPHVNSDPSTATLKLLSISSLQ